MITGLEPQLETVQSGAMKAGGRSATSSATRRRPWRWSYAKRKALRRLMRGWPDTVIAAVLGVHRNTIRAWRRRPEFQAEFWRKATDYAMTMRLRRMHETGIVLDQIAAQVARTIQRLKDGHAISQVEVNALRVFADEYARFREHERQDFSVIAACMEHETRTKTAAAEAETVRQIQVLLGARHDEAAE